MTIAICAFTFVLLLVFLDVHNPRTRMMEGIKAIDWAGSLSILAVTLMLLLGLDFGGKTFPWSSPKVICLIVFGCVSILVFLFSEKKIAKYPLMPLAIFKNRSNIASLLVAFAHGIVSLPTDRLPFMYANNPRSCRCLLQEVSFGPIISLYCTFTPQPTRTSSTSNVRASGGVSGKRSMLTTSKNSICPSICNRPREQALFDQGY